MVGAFFASGTLTDTTRLAALAERKYAAGYVHDFFRLPDLLLPPSLPLLRVSFSKASNEVGNPTVKKDHLRRTQMPFLESYGPSEYPLLR